MATSRTDGFLIVAGNPQDPRAGARRTALWVGLLAFGVYVAFLLKAVLFGL
jgi:hypothetical protein